MSAAAVIGEVPILAFVGSNGGGKSLAAVYAVLPTLYGLPWHCLNPDHLHTHGDGCAARRMLSTEPTAVCSCETTWETVTGGREVVELAEGGTVDGFRHVLSTVELRNPDNPTEVSAHYTRLRSFVQLLAVEHTDVLLDEVTGIASARSSMSLPVQVENLIQQLRRRDARMLWTTPDFGNADVRIRSVTKCVVLCRGRFSNEKKGAWPQSRLFRWTIFDASEFDRFTVSKGLRLQPVGVQTFWRPGHVAQTAYDTSAAVVQLGAASEGGMCFSCGGRRSMPGCTCPTDPERLPAGTREVITPSGGRRRELIPVEAVSS